MIKKYLVLFFCCSLGCYYGATIGRSWIIEELGMCVPVPVPSIFFPALMFYYAIGLMFSLEAGGVVSELSLSASKATWIGA